MSAEPVTCEVLGQTVEAMELDRVPQADISQGPREIVVVEVDGSTWRVDEDDVEP